MIFDYAITILFYLLLGLFYYIFGFSISHKYKLQESTEVLIGFFIHTIFLALIGILFQILRLEWQLYFYISIFWFISCLVFSIYNIRRSRMQLFKSGFLSFIKKYWFFVLMIIIFVICLFCNAGRLWADNLTDDGYYLVRIANLPYANNSMMVDNITGLKTTGMGTYALNTWELEMSVYLSIVHVLPTIFIRFGLATFNFILICCGVHSLIANLRKKFNKQIHENNYQYYCFIVMPAFLVMNLFIQSFLEIHLEDTWKNTSALFYGSSLVRMLGPIVLLNYILTIEKIKVRNIFEVSIISIVLLSRSTTAIPLIFLISCAFLIIYLFKNNKLLFIGMIMLMAIAAFIFPNNAILFNYTIDRVSNNLTSILTFIILGLYIILVCIKKEYQNFKYLILLILIYLLIIIEPINNIYENLSIYDFVSGRTLYSIYFLLYICLISILLINIFEKTNKTKKIISFFSIVCASFFIVLTQHGYEDVITVNMEQSKNDTIKQSLSVAKKNMALTPDSTINVGNKLHELEKKSNHRLKVITTFDWVVVDGYAHYPSLTYRVYAPNIYNYTAIFRTLGPNVTTGEYTWGEHSSICQFANNPTDENYEKINGILEEKDFDCIVSTNGELEGYLKNNGYELFDQIIDNNGVNAYYIYVK